MIIDKDIELLILYDVYNKIGRLQMNPQYLSAWKYMWDRASKEKQNKYVSMNEELHCVWNFVNTRQGSVDDYVKICAKSGHPTQNPELFDILFDYNITLKNEISQKSKNILVEFLGKDKFENWFGDYVIIP